TWLAFTPFASAIPATLAPGSSVSFTILSFSSTLRKIRRLRIDDALASMRPIVSRRSSSVQMGRPDAYVPGVRSDEYRESSSDERHRNEENWPQPKGL